ncbi:MAG: GNAT family N-acetyltransferase [Acidobacteria bacterium]|nr:GNAT family N-acetyltransferase [Acidobacteriota bacterium]MBI3423644.1 GNAT family N-acetyltransferase [Acidobacteriota bacterium]
MSLVNVHKQTRSNLVSVTVAEDPSLADKIEELDRQSWPPYLLQAHKPFESAFNVTWLAIYDYWPECQFGLFDKTTGELVAWGNSAPLAWTQRTDDLPNTGWDWAMHQAFLGNINKVTPNALAALGISVRQAARNQGISAAAIATMKQIARRLGCDSLIAPVRPSLKSLYPLTPITEYLTWQDDTGLPFDPWLRTHLRLGATIIKACPQSMRLTGKVADWEKWTGLKFPASQHYVVPQMLSTLKIDREKDEGIYVEPNVWMEHKL